MKKINKIPIGFYTYKYKWYSLAFGTFILVALLTGKVFETLFILIGYKFFRYVFPSTLHLDIVKECIITNTVMIGFMILSTINIHISIYFSLIYTFIVCLLLYVIDYIISLIRPKIAKSNRDKIIELLNGDTSQDNIFLLCRNCGLKDEVANSVDLFLTNTLEETAEILEVDVRTIQRRIKKFIEECSK
jgi:hypothetical protein